MRGLQTNSAVGVSLRYLAASDFFFSYNWPAFLDGFGKFKCASGDVDHSRKPHERVETLDARFKFHISASNFSIFLLLKHFEFKSGRNAFETLIVVFC